MSRSVWLDHDLGLPLRVFAKRWKSWGKELPEEEKKGPLLKAARFASVRARYGWGRATTSVKSMNTSPACHPGDSALGSA